jgi:hypothetical protein
MMMRLRELRLRDKFALHPVVFNEKDKIAIVCFCETDQFFHFPEVGIAG